MNSLLNQLLHFIGNHYQWIFGSILLQMWGQAIIFTVAGPGAIVMTAGTVICAKPLM